MLFVAAGVLLGPQILDWVDIQKTSKPAELLAEVTLALILFNDASLVDWPSLKRNRGTPIRLLAIALPLMIIVGGFAAALLVEGIEFWQAALIAVILAPTDAALGQAVVMNPKVPKRIRQSLMVESGLNDGIAAPLVVIFIAASGIAGSTGSDSDWLLFMARELGFGLLIGAGIGLAGAVLVGRAYEAGWIDHIYEQVVIAAVAIAAFSFATVAEGNGLIAAFVAGIAFGNVARQLKVTDFRFSEESASVLMLVTLFVFGSVMAGPALNDLTWKVALYAFLSLLVIRPAVVAVSMLGSGFRLPTIAFLGWFGPRGIASVVFALQVIGKKGLPGADEIALVVTWTVLISIFAHGLTAQPGAKWYGNHAAEFTSEDGDVPELDPVENVFRYAASMIRGRRAFRAAGLAIASLVIHPQFVFTGAPSISPSGPTAETQRCAARTRT
jgi:NhaP-type Na+/H+ or K+/H+ antiporter